MTTFSGDDYWLSDGRKRLKERLESGDEEYEEFVKENYPYMYWQYDFTPDPPPEVVEELGLEE